MFALLGAALSSVISAGLWLLVTSFLLPELASGGFTGVVIFGVWMFVWMFGVFWWLARRATRTERSP